MADRPPEPTPLTSESARFETLVQAVQQLHTEYRDNAKLLAKLPDMYQSVEVAAKRERRFKRLVFGMGAGLLVAGLLVAGMVWLFRTQETRHQREAVETDRAFCAAVNDGRDGINRNSERIDATQEASRQAYTRAIAPSPDDPPERAAERQRLLNDLLSTLDSVPPAAPKKLLDCSGIGDGEINFSLQEAIRDAGWITTTTNP